MKGRAPVRLSVEQETLLIRDVQSGNRAEQSAAIKNIIDSYYPLIQYFLKKVPSDIPNADEVLSDFQTEVFYAVRTFDPTKGSKLSTHIYNYLDGLCNKLIKKAYTLHTYIHLADDIKIDTEDGTEKAVSDRFVVYPSVEQSLDEEFLVNSMPANLRPTAKCIIIDKYTQAKTAQYLGVSKPAICKRLEKIHTLASLFLN